MSWSEETLALRDRYQTLYGVAQGLNIGALASGLLFAREGGWRQWALVGLAWVAWAFWRWSWRVYQRAYRAELDGRVLRAKEEFEQAMARFQ